MVLSADIVNPVVSGTAEGTLRVRDGARDRFSTICNVNERTTHTTSHVLHCRPHGGRGSGAVEDGRWGHGVFRMIDVDRRGFIARAR